MEKVSYDVLRSYPDVEGGYLLDDKVIGHSFPTYTEPGSKLYQPVLEHEKVLSALAESKETGKVARRVVQDRKDLVLVAVLTSPNSTLAAWGLRRILNFSDSSELTKRYLLVLVMFVSLISIGIVLRLSLGLQHEFGLIRSGLESLQTDPDYRLPDQGGELRTIVQAINSMAHGRQELETALRREDRLRLMGERGTRPPRLTVDQARRTAAELPGSPIQNIDFLFCAKDEGDYLSFTDSSGSVWLFRRKRDRFEKVPRSGSLDGVPDQTGLAILPSEKLPAVRFLTQSGGTGVGEPHPLLCGAGRQVAVLQDEHDTFVYGSAVVSRRTADLVHECVGMVVRPFLWGGQPEYRSDL